MICSQRASTLFALNILQYVQDVMGRRGRLQRHFGSDKSVWRDGDWNGFVRIAVVDGRRGFAMVDRI